MNCPMPLEKLFLELMALSTAGASSSLLTGLDMARHIISKCLIGHGNSCEPQEVLRI